MSAAPREARPPEARRDDPREALRQIAKMATIAVEGVCHGYTSAKERQQAAKEALERINALARAALASPVPPPGGDSEDKEAAFQRDLANGEGSDETDVGAIHPNPYSVRRFLAGDTEPPPAGDRVMAVIGSMLDASEPRYRDAAGFVRWSVVERDIRSAVHDEIALGLRSVLSPVLPPGETP